MIKVRPLYFLKLLKFQKIKYLIQVLCQSRANPPPSDPCPPPWVPPKLRSVGAALHQYPRRGYYKRFGICQSYRVMKGVLPDKIISYKNNNKYVN